MSSRASNTAPHSSFASAAATFASALHALRASFVERFRQIPVAMKKSSFTSVLHAWRAAFEVPVQSFSAADAVLAVSAPRSSAVAAIDAVVFMVQSSLSAGRVRPRVHVSASVGPQMRRGTSP